MPFIIDDTVMFNEVKGSLTNIDTVDEIRLPPTAVCILLMLFINKGSPVERGELIDQVNMRFGFDLSNNTLNQYVSMLRKNIRNLGVESDVIMTIPKVGFYISSDVKVEIITDELSDPEPDEEPTVAGKRKRKFVTLMIMAAISLMVSEIIYVLLPAETEPKEYPLVKNGKIGECDLYLPINLDRVHLPDTRKNAAELAERYLPCTSGSVYIYDINAINFINGTGKVYLARCTGLPGQDRYAACSEVAFSEQ